MTPKSVVEDFKNLLQAGSTSNLSPEISKISRSPVGQNLSPEISKISRRSVNQNLSPEISSYRAALSTVANTIVNIGGFT